jgi:hypothetical protein
MMHEQLQQYALLYVVSITLLWYETKLSEGPHTSVFKV